MSHTSIAIIGAGFSGTTLALQLANNAKPPLRIQLIDPRGAVRPWARLKDFASSSFDERAF